MKPGDLVILIYKDQELADAVKEIGMSNHGKIGIILEHKNNDQFSVLIDNREMVLPVSVMELVNETR